MLSQYLRTVFAVVAVTFAVAVAILNSHGTQGYTVFANGIPLSSNGLGISAMPAVLVTKGQGEIQTGDILLRNNGAQVMSEVSLAKGGVYLYRAGRRLEFRLAKDFKIQSRFVMYTQQVRENAIFQPKDVILAIDGRGFKSGAEYATLARNVGARFAVSFLRGGIGQTESVTTLTRASYGRMLGYFDDCLPPYTQGTCVSSFECGPLTPEPTCPCSYCGICPPSGNDPSPVEHCCVQFQ